MNILMLTRHLLWFLLVPFFVTALTARAETTNCNSVTASGTIISAPGIYCLTSNIDAPSALTSGEALNITASNVVLDLNGWRLDGQAAGMGTQAIGIKAEGDNITIKNGTVSGFYSGLVAQGRNALVSDIRADKNTYMGMFVWSEGGIIRRNQVTHTGGSTLATNVRTYGIAIRGTGNLVEGNLVSSLTGAAGGYEYGIFVADSHRSIVRNNVVTDDAKPTGGSVGIQTVISSGVNIRGNDIINFTNGISYGLLSGGKYMDNLTSNVDSAFVGTGTAVGTNH